MKLFIFDAGASYTSQNHLYKETNLRCPLTRELFDGKFVKYLDLVFFRTEDFEFFKKGYSPDLDLENWLTKKWNQLEQMGNPRAKDRGLNLFSKFTFCLCMEYFMETFPKLR